MTRIIGMSMSMSSMLPKSRQMKRRLGMALFLCLCAIASLRNSRPSTSRPSTSRPSTSSMMKMFNLSSLSPSATPAVLSSLPVINTAASSSNANRTASSHTSNRSSHGATSSSPAPSLADSSSSSSSSLSSTTSSAEEKEAADKEIRKPEFRNKVQEWLSSFESDSDNNKFMALRPPNTPGAVIHVGKTGGSTLCSQLRNGCHSWVAKPCNGKKLNATTEAHISKLSSYYHTPDFELLASQEQRQYPFYVWAIRDPFARTLSAFTYQHPLNVAAAKEKFWKQKVAAMREVYEPCFPTMERFAMHLSNIEQDNVEQVKVDYPFQPTVVNATNCTRLARAILQGKVKKPEHLYYSMKSIQDRIVHEDDAQSSVIFVIRTEHLWQDWTTSNEWLGQKTGSVVTFPNIKSRQQNTTHIPVTKDISTQGRRRLCLALRAEYQAYFNLLQRAANLDDEQRQESYALAHRNCPVLFPADEISNDAGKRT